MAHPVKGLLYPEHRELVSGQVTDVYFFRTKNIIANSHLKDVKVRMEVHSYKLPRRYDWAVFAGLWESIELLEGLDVNVYSIPEGTVYYEKEPLMLIEGRYADIAMLETALLGILRHATTVATKSARIKRLAGDKTVLFFGLRSAHPLISLVLDKYSYIGGADGVSGLLAEKYLGLKPRGTMPHALIIAFGDQIEAWKHYAEMYGQDGVIALVDTFCDERFESLLAAETLKDKLIGVRLDTPGSRRGRMKDIIEEVRWTLDVNGYKHVKIFISGGIDEKEIVELRDLADGFGVGTSIAWATNIDISMDIVEVDRGNGWTPITKRGKLPAAKMLYRCPDGSDYITRLEETAPTCPDGSEAKQLLEKIIESGRLVKHPPSIEEIRNYVLEQVNKLPPPEPRD
ncbi:MAG: nicotinate phosphoribosyltransferase [Desulfurococcales archaeon]|nr:nicotinate phosphoribosyltransferase [Desulfurococcales archaeon]